jgi:hypothetical protein
MKGRIISIAIVLGTTSATILSLGMLSYCAGQRTPPLERFLWPGLAPTVDEAFVSFPVEYSLRSDEANDVVFLGDSTCHDDIDPARLHEKCYNLGSLGSVGPLGILLTTEAYLDHHPAPRVIVLCISPLRFEVNSGSAGGYVARHLVESYGVEVADVVPFAQSVSYFVRRGAVGIRARSRAPLPLFDSPLVGMDTETFHSLERRMKASKGFFALPGEHGGRWQVETPAPKQFILEEWRDGFRRLATICGKSHVRLIVRFGPIWEGVSRSRNFGALDEWGDEVESAFPHVRIQRPIIMAWERPLMWDCLHLNAAGVARFMPIVAKDVEHALRRQPGG